MKLPNWITQRFGSRNTAPKSTVEKNDDVDRFMQSLMGVMGWYQSYLEILTALEVTANSEAEASRLNEQIADTAKQAIQGMSTVFREWADYLDDQSRPTPTIPTASLAAVLSPDATNAGSSAPHNAKA